MNGTNDGIRTPTRQGAARTGGRSNGGRARRKRKHHLLEASRSFQRAPRLPGGFPFPPWPQFSSSLSDVVFRHRTMSSTKKRILYIINHRDTTPLSTPWNLSAMGTRRLFSAYFLLLFRSPTLPRLPFRGPQPPPPDAFLLGFHHTIRRTRRPFPPPVSSQQ